MGIRAVCYPVHRFECTALEYTLSNHPPPFTTSLVPATRRDPNETSSSLLDQSMRVSACQTSFFIHPSPSFIHFCPITPSPGKRVALFLSLSQISANLDDYSSVTDSYHHIYAEDGSCWSRIIELWTFLSIVQPFWCLDEMEISNVIYEG